MGVRFAQNLADHGERLALLAGDGRHLSYRALDALVAARAAELGTARRLILWEARPDPAAIVTYLAALRAGHPILPVAPLDTHPHAARHRAALIDTYRPDVIEGDKRDTIGQGPESDYHPDLSLLLSTSGSTGAAKLVRLSAANLDANAAAIADYLALTPDDCAALVLPLHYTYGLSVLHSHLSVGAGIYLGTPSILGADFIARIKAARCTNISGVPYSIELLEQIGFRDAVLPDLRFMTVAGGRLSPDLVRLYAGHLARRDAQFFVMYGQTEATSRIAYLPPWAAQSHADCIGDAIPGGALSLIDEDGRAIDQAMTRGELVYRGPNVMMGYAETRADLARAATCTTLHTGDLAERTEAGFYRITGRLNRFSKIAGLRISHDALERAFEKRGVTLAITGDDRDIRAAFAGGHDAASLRVALAREAGLTPAFIRVVAVAALPRQANGKMDYTALASLFATQAPTSSPASSPGSIQAAFAETFAPRRVTPTDSFITLGGDSLSFVQLSLALEPIMGTVPRDWEQRSIADLAALSPIQPIHDAPPSMSPIALWRKWRADWRPLDANHFMRALAILFIVLHHATMWEIAGGAATLLMLVGYNLARFQSARLIAGRVTVTLRAVLRPLLLYYAVLLTYCVYSGSYPWQSLTLLGNLGIDGYSTMPTPLVTYWFIDAYAQVMLLMAGVFLIPAMRAAVAKRPFAAGLVFLGFAILAREIQPTLWNAGEMKAFTTPRVIYLVAIGWCVYFADDLRRRLFMTALVVTLFLLLPWFEEAKASILWVRAGILVASSITLLWWASISLPRRLGSLLSAVAAASYSIYLFHNVPFFLWLEDAGLPKPADDIAHFVLGLGLGCAAHHLLQAFSRWARRTSMAQLLWRSSNTRLQPGE